VVVAVMSQGETREVLEEYWSNIYLRGTMIFDPTGAISQGRYSLPMTPTPFGRSFLIGHDQKVLAVSHGYDPQGAIDAIESALAARFGGVVSALDVDSVSCVNSSSGREEELSTGEAGWLCDVPVATGDRVQQVLTGSATGTGPIAGTFDGMTIQRLACQNLSSGQLIRRPHSGSAWDCAQWGFVAQPGDQVRVTGQGVAK
jgi:hypothetical protein